MSTDLAAGATSILITWLLLAAGLAGLGLLVAPPSRFGGISAERLFVDFWIGLCIALAFLMVWHLALPIGGSAALVLVAASAAGWLRARAPVGSYLGARPWRGAIPWLALGLALSFWIANRASGPAAHYDAGSYHIPALLWWKSHPMPPGLANLHDRFGFNNSSLLFTALLDQGPWYRRAEHLNNGLLIWAFAMQLLHRCFGLRRGAVDSRLAAFDLLLLAPVLVFVLRPDMISSLMIAVPVSLVLFRASSLLFGLAVRSTEPPDSELHDALAASALFALAPTIKLSGVFLAALGGLATVALVWRRSRSGAPESRRVVTASMALAVAVLGLWMGRGVLLSGWPAYPSSLAPFPVAWQVPEAQAEAHRAWIAHSARYFHSAELRNFGAFEDGPPWRGAWFRPWLRAVWEGDQGARWFVLEPLVLCGLFAGILVFFRRHLDVKVRGSWWVLAPAAVAAVAWILTAPKPRFGLFSLWILAAGLGAPILGVWLRQPGRSALAALLLGALGTLPWSASLVRGGPRHATVVWVQPPRGEWLHQRDEPEVERVRNELGLELAVPLEDNRCFDAALPCTPHPAPNVQLRVPDDPGGGFVTEGPWVPARWPNSRSAFLENWQGRPEPPH